LDLDSSLVSIENLSEIFGLAVGPRSGAGSQKSPKTYLLTMIFIKTQNQKIFFHYGLKDLPSFLRVWTAL